MTAVIYHKSISTLLANEVIPRVYKKPRCDFRSPLRKIPKQYDIWIVHFGGISTGISLNFNQSRVVYFIIFGRHSFFYIAHQKLHAFFAQGLPGEKGDRSNLAGPKGLPVRIKYPRFECVVFQFNSMDR